MLNTLLSASAKGFRSKHFWKIKQRSYSTQQDIREYFYYIDLHGQLFLENTKPKNFTTCFKDKRFLNFFFQRLRVNHTNRNEQYPYLSPCGRELNFIVSEDTPIVFTDLEAEQLIWAGDKKFLFQPEKLIVSGRTGRLYHSSPKTLVNKSGFEDIALLKSSLVLSKLAEHLDLEKCSFTWKGVVYPIEISDNF